MPVQGEHPSTTSASPPSLLYPSESILHRFIQLHYLLITLLLVDSFSIDRSPAWPEGFL